MRGGKGNRREKGEGRGEKREKASRKRGKEGGERGGKLSSPRRVWGGRFVVDMDHNGGETRPNGPEVSRPVGRATSLLLVLLLFFFYPRIFFTVSFFFSPRLINAVRLGS